MASLVVVSSHATVDVPGARGADAKQDGARTDDARPSLAEREAKAAGGVQAGALVRREVNQHRQGGLPAEITMEADMTTTTPCDRPGDEEEDAAPQWHYCKLPKTYSTHEQREYIDCIGTICQDVEGEFIQKTINATLADCTALVDYYKDCMIDLGTQSHDIAPATLLGHICNTKCPQMCRSFIQEKARGADSPTAQPSPWAAQYQASQAKARAQAASVSTPPPSLNAHVQTVGNPPLPHKHGVERSAGAQDAEGAPGGRPFDAEADIDAASRKIAGQSHRGAQPLDSQPAMPARAAEPLPSREPREPVGDARVYRPPTDYPVDEWREEHRDQGNEGGGGQVYSVELPPLPVSMAGGNPIVDQARKHMVPVPQDWPPLPKGPIAKPPAQPLLQDEVH